jgi:hypothetical protein
MYYFNRHFALKSFGRFLGEDVFSRLRGFLPGRRTRLLGLEGFVWAGLFVAGNTNSGSLEEIFGRAVGECDGSLPVPLVSVSAFSQYRRGFPLSALVRLWRLLLEKFDECCGAPLWRGLKVSAIDIVTLCLGEEFWEEFGSHGGARGEGAVIAPMAVLYDVASRAPVAFRLGEADADERSLAKRLFKRLGAASLLLFDVGLYSIEIFAMLKRRGADFVTPMRSNARPQFVKRLGPNEGLYIIRRSRVFKNRPDVPETMTVRIITTRRPGFEKRRLVTSLIDHVKYPAAEIEALYHARWHIETFFREFKHTLQAQHFHARRKKALLSEIIFQMILCTLTRLAMADAAQQSGAAPGEISFTKALSQIKNVLEITATLPAKKWPALYLDLVKWLARCKIDVRPGRSFERDKQKRRRKSRSRRPAQLKRRQTHAA